MSSYQAAQDRDANRVTVSTNGAFKQVKQVAFTGAAGLGAVGTVNLFTVTGTVLVSVFAVCSENLAGATATLEIGISGNTQGVIPQVTATDVDDGEILVSGGGLGTVENLSAESKVLTGGTDVIATVGTADITDGTLTFYCLWRPLSDDGNVVAA